MFTWILLFGAAVVAAYIAGSMLLRPTAADARKVVEFPADKRRERIS